MKKLIFAFIIFLALVSPVWAAVKYLIPDGNGTYTQWIGVYTGVDDTVASSCIDDAVNSETANQRETYTLRDCSNTSWGDSIPDAATIDSVRGYWRGQEPLEGSANWYTYWYDGTNRDSTLKTVDAACADFYHTRTTDLGGGSWSKADINNLQLGMRTIGSPTGDATIYIVRLGVYYTVAEASAKANERRVKVLKLLSEED